MHLGQLRWQCRRGMKELDALMVRFLDERYLDASAEEKQAFEDILQMSDPQLIGYFLKGESADTESLQSVIRQILG